MKKITRLLILAAVFSVLAAPMAFAGPGGKGEGDPEIPLGPARTKSPAAQIQSNTGAIARGSTSAAALADSESREDVTRWVQILKAYIRLTRVFSL